MGIGVLPKYYTTKELKALTNCTQAELDDIIKNKIIKPSIKAPERGISAQFDFEDLVGVIIYKTFKNSGIKRSVLIDVMNATKSLRARDSSESPFTRDYSGYLKFCVAIYAHEYGAVIGVEQTSEGNPNLVGTAFYPVGKKKFKGFDVFRVPEEAVMKVEINLTKINTVLKKKIKESQV